MIPQRSGRVAAAVLVVVAAVTACTTDEGSFGPSSTRGATHTTDAPRTARPGSCTGPPVPAAELQVFGGRPRPVVPWILPVGGIDADSDQIDGIAVDRTGTTVVSGVFRNRVDIGATTLESRGAGDIFLASIGRDGTLNWVRHYGGNGDDNTYDLDVDLDGDVVISGWYTGTVDFGAVTLEAAGGTDMFVAKVTADGDVNWARSFGGTHGDGGNEVAVDDDGEIAVSAITAGDFVVDDTTYPFGGGQRDSLAIRMGPDGTVRWVHHFDGPGNERMRAIALGDDGHVAVGFQYRGGLRSGDTVLRSRGGWDGALARLTPDGDLDWLVAVGGEGTDNVRGAGIAPDGRIYASGMITDDVVVVDRNLGGVGEAGDDFIAELTPDGTLEWVATFGGAGRGVGAEIEVDANGVVASALLDGEVTVRLGDDEVAVVSPPNDRPTSYAAALDPAGELRFVFTPTAAPPDGGAFGDVLGVSPGGAHLVQALRFGGTVAVGDRPVTTPGAKDSAVVFVCLDGA